jgi:hypothetical protein
LRVESGIVHDEKKCRKSYARAKVLEQGPRSKTGEKGKTRSISVLNKGHKEVRQVIKLRTTGAGKEAQKKRSERIRKKNV